MPPVEFEPTISVGKRAHTYTLDSADTGTNKKNILLYVIYDNSDEEAVFWFS
jgi:hypothetical protein